MISALVIVDENLGIGYQNKLLAKIPEDVKYFKELTLGHLTIMGYNTYESIPDRFRPLPNRPNLVITSRDIEIDGVIVKHGIEETLDYIEKEHPGEEVFVIGGSSIFKQFMEHFDRLYVTHIFRQFEADTYFPDINDDWELAKVSAERENIDHKFPHIFAVYERKNK